MSGGKGGGQTQSTSSAPWGAQKDYLKKGFGEAANIYQNNLPQYFPGQTYNPYGQTTLAALGAQQNRAVQGSPYEQIGMNALAGFAGGGAGGGSGFGPQQRPYQTSGGSQQPQQGGSPNQGYLGNVAGGGEIGGNPYLDATFDRAAGRVSDIYSKSTAPSTQAAFSGAGRFGSDAHKEYQQMQQEGMGDQLNNLATGIYGGAYEQDQGRRMQASGMIDNSYQQGMGRQLNAAQQLPGMSQQIDYNNIGQLGQAGQAIDAKAFQGLQDQIGRFNFGQQLPMNWLSQYMGMVNGNYGGTQEGTSSKALGLGDYMSMAGAGAKAYGLSGLGGS